MSAVELNRYSPLHSPTPQPRPQRDVSIWDLFVAAAKSQYGESIEVIDSTLARNALHNIKFEIGIVSSDPRPVEVSRAVVDIVTKEYTNPCEKEVDETVVKVAKSTAGWTGGRYHFSTTRGSYSGIGGDIGPQVINMAITRCSTTVGLTSNQAANAIRESDAHEFSFGYTHKEKITVPPLSRVKATITSYSVNYEQGHTILFSIPSSVQIPVYYRTSFQQTMANFCCCYNQNLGYVSVARVCSSLPEFREANGLVSFVQRGTLSWIGEGGTIVKDVETL